MSSASAAHLLDALTARLDAACRDLGRDTPGDDGSAPEYRLGVVSVSLRDLDGSAIWEREADDGHYAASTMKLPLVIGAQRQIARGELEAERAVQVRNEFASVADGSPFSMDEGEDQDPATWNAVGGTRTVHELMESAIIESGNLATNLLIDLVGLAEIATVLSLAGCSETTVVGRGIEDAVAREAGITNRVSAADLAVLMAAVARADESLGGPQVCGPVEALLARQAHQDQIPSGLPADYVIANKTGWIPGISHDVALVRAPGRDPVVLAICTSINLSETDGAAFVATIARDLHGADLL